MKRITDIFFSLIILLISSPLLILCAIAIKIDSPGPVFFIQDRAGKDGIIFKMIKFRGMINHATRFGPELTQINDPRITRMGKILRRTSIDEIPNFFNVLMGEMSIIGPRPEIIPVTSKYSTEQRKVFKYKPGITGYSQINGRQMLTPDERVQMEVAYYEHENLWGDIKILFNTIQVVITNDGNT